MLRAGGELWRWRPRKITFPISTTRSTTISWCVCSTARLSLDSLKQSASLYPPPTATDSLPVPPAWARWPLGRARPCGPLNRFAESGFPQLIAQATSS